MFIRSKLGRFIKGNDPKDSPKWLATIQKRAKERRNNRPKIICCVCEKEFQVPVCRKNIAKTCSFKCGRVSSSQSNKKRPKKPTLSSQGYFFIKKWGHHRANYNGYVKIADLVLEEKLGRKLKKNEIAHHIDRNKQNDNPENLELMNKTQHDKMHTIERHKHQKVFGRNILK